MRHLAGLFMLFAIVGLAVPALAQGRSPGVEGFVAEVLARNPSLQARVLTRNAAERQAEAAGLWPDPEAAGTIVIGAVVSLAAKLGAAGPAAQEGGAYAAR